MDAHTQMAAEAISRGNGHRALEHLAEVTDLSNPYVWQLRASAAALANHHAAAEDASRRGLSLAPSDIGLHLTLADSLASQGRHSEAEGPLLSVLNQHPEHHPALRQYAWLLARTGDAQGARHVIARMSAATQASDPGILALQGYVAMIEGNRKHAQEFLAAGLAMAPEATGIRMLKALELSLNDRPAQAVDQMRAAASLDPELAGHMGRQARYLGHPLMRPIRWVDRIGPSKLWIGWIVILFGLPRVWPAAPMVPIVVVYLSLVVYSWTVPFVLRKWMQSRGQL